jgi:predicted amidohydrolase
MTHILTFGAAQLGPIARADSRDTVRSTARHDAQSARRGCDVIVYPELALTTFSPFGFSRTKTKSTHISNVESRQH